MKLMKRNKGFTLIEIIVSIAILGIILIVFLSAFSTGATNTIFSGQKSSKLMELQTITDDLNAQPFYSKADVESYLGTTNSYYKVADINQISTKVTGEDVNFYVSDQETKAGTKGYSVAILKFTDNGKRYARVSTFVLERGS